MLSQALDKDTVLKVIMQIPPPLLSPVVMVCVCTYMYVCRCECSVVSAAQAACE